MPDAISSAYEAATVDIPLRVLDLIDRFAALRKTGDEKGLNETTIRETFLNPLLEELGWDPRNRRGVATTDRDVLLEDKLYVDGQSTAPDYAMVTGGKRRFFVEAKRPSVNIEQSKASAFQIRRYCWSAGLPLGLLTDFEEIAVYDCRQMPNITDSPSVSRTLYFRFDELPERWTELHSLFSKEAVSSGALDRFAADTKAPAGSRPIDDAFLDEIRRWRTSLASDIARNNVDLDIIELNEVVQQLIDRLIFLRIAEARGLEPVRGLLRAIEGSGDHYNRLLGLFRRADDRYNSGLFHMSERDELRGDPDLRSSVLVVSNEPLETIIERMYYPHPYEFAALPADILGRIYEQFLGEQIFMDDDRNVVVDLKIEVRKAGGVYYTPEPIVNYIVEQSIGPLLEGKRPQEVAKLRIVDPACGSGSFLIAAYQYLIDWHRDYYSGRVNLAKEHLEATPDGSLRLKTATRRKILTNNIYGVDIDAQAVEVTKLSLLLKVIEGQSQMELDVGRILPDLDSYIACGNSLIEPDFSPPVGANIQDQQGYNPFSWSAKWPRIMENGGFDAVIGNPPYLNIDNVWGKGDSRSAYVKRKYSEVYSDKTDLLFYFLIRSAQISRGEVSLIVSRSFLEGDKARRLRGWLGENVRFREILDFRHALVFPKVGINTVILHYTSSRAVKETRVRRLIGRTLPVGYEAETLRQQALTKNVQVNYKDFTSAPWSFGNESIQTLIKKIDKAGVRIGDILHIGQGMQTGANKAFTLDIDEETYQELNDAGLAYKRVPNSVIREYVFEGKTPIVAFPNRAQQFDDLPDVVKEHLRQHRKTLENRAAFKRGNCEWWQYTWPLHISHLQKPRIFSPYMAGTNRFALDEACDYLGLTDTTVLYDVGQPEDLRYLMAVLNSRILTFRFRFIGKLVGGGQYEYFENTVSELPVPRVGRGEPRHDEIVGLVSQRIEAMSELKTAHIKADRDLIEGVLRAVDQELEAKIADLYGLDASDLEAIGQELGEG
ncbi:Eco57I restriction-modification methylase domain-containing protein [Dietzia maris]|uniref:Eco57I restriction-modification methylase domain-containing protein n=1 Tax=Dietzia maris TaxID=37915 RepID=UPI0037C6A9CF